MQGWVADRTASRSAERGFVAWARYKRAIPSWPPSKAPSLPLTSPLMLVVYLVRSGPEECERP